MLISLYLIQHVSGAEYGVRRRTVPEFILVLREKTSQHLVGQELAIERIAYTFKGVSNEGCQVYRFVGPTGTGKSSLACFVASSLFDLVEGFDDKVCMSSTDTTQLGPYVLSRTFSKAGGHEAQVLRLFDEANRKLEKYAEGIVIILNDYNLAGEAVWSFMREFVKQENMRNSVVILTDDLTPDAANDFKSNLKIRLVPGMKEAEAMEMILDETKRVYPPEFVDMTTNDVWVPFLPFAPRAVESLIELSCEDMNIFLKEEIDGYLGVLVCDLKSTIQATLKLDKCVAESGARTLTVFEEAFREVLNQRMFCEDPTVSWSDCVTERDLPIRSIVFQVNPTIEQGSDCSTSSMEKWISFRLFDLSCTLSEF